MLLTYSISISISSSLSLPITQPSINETNTRTFLDTELTMFCAQSKVTCRLNKSHRLLIIAARPPANKWNLFAHINILRLIIGSLTLNSQRPYTLADSDSHTLNLPHIFILLVIYYHSNLFDNVIRFEFFSLFCFR